MDGLSVFKKAVNNDKYPLSKFLRDWVRKVGAGYGSSILIYSPIGSGW